MNKPGFEYSIGVLIVGPDQETRNLLGETLRAIGYKTYMAEECSGTGDILRGRKIDFIFCDSGLPPDDSFEFIRDVKRNYPGIPVVLLAESDQFDSPMLLEAGSDGVLAKPFRIAKVEELISSILIKYDRIKAEPKKEKRNILAVDDDPGILRVLRDGLEIMGFYVTTANSGSEALDLFIKRKFDLVITDFMMPDLTGKELIVHFKKINPEIPVVMITGYPLAYPPAVARDEGISAYLVKPFRLIQLKEVINELLNSH